MDLELDAGKKKKPEKKKATWLIDIEVYGDLFFCGIKDYKKQTVHTYEISERKDDRERLYNDLSNFDGFLVSFNGLHYDEVVLKYFLQEYDKKLLHSNVATLCFYLKRISDSVIDEDFDVIGTYKYIRTKWTSIDLYCYWARMTRISKKISLKGLGIQLNYDEVQELPFDPNHLFGSNDADIEELIRYNIRNDLGVLELLFKEMRPDIELRHYLLVEYGLSCWSMDASKIASEYFLNDYCEKTYDKDEHGAFWEYKKKVRNTRYEKPPFVLGDYLPKVEFKLDVFKKVYEDYKKCTGTYSNRIPFIHNATKMIIVPSVGGIHSENNNQIWESDDEFVVVDSDIALK